MRNYRKRWKDGWERITKRGEVKEEGIREGVMMKRRWKEKDEILRDMRRR